MLDLEILSENLNLVVAGSYPDSYKLWRHLAVGKNRLLWDGLRTGVESKNPESRRLLKICCELLQSAETLEQIRSFYRRYYPGVDLDADSLHSAAVGLGFTARAAAAAQDAESNATLQPELWQRAFEAAVLLNGGPAITAPQMPALDKAASAPLLIKEVYARIKQAGIPTGVARFWTLWWLRNPNDHTAPDVRVPVAGMHHKGFVADLCLWRLEAGQGTAYHPEHALPPLGRELVSVIKAALQRADCSICWSLVIREHRIKGLPLDGESVSGPAHVAVRLLKHRVLWDQNKIVVAGVGVDRESLETVAHQEEKLKAAAELGIRFAAVATKGSKDSESPLIPSQIRSLGEHPHQITVVPLDTVSQAERFVSERVSAMRKYLDNLSTYPDRREAHAAYQGKPTRSQLFVEPDVLIRDPRSDGEQSQGEDYVDEPDEEDAEREAREVGAGSTHVETGARAEWQRASWSAERETMEAGGSWRAVLLGDPGQGKSLFLEMRASKQSELAFGQLKRHEAGADSIDLPLLVSMRTLTDYIATGAVPAVTMSDEISRELREQANDPHQQMHFRVRNALAVALQDQGVPDSAIVALVTHVHEPRAWLFLDALDEVRSEDALPLLFAALKDWQCRVLMTSRYGYRRHRLQAPFPMAQLRIAPFSRSQVRAFIKTFYKADNSGLVTAMQLLDNNTAFARLSDNPFLLTLLCAVTRAGGVPRHITRTALYEKAMSLLLRSNARTGYWLPFLAEMAWKMPSRMEIEHHRLCTLLRNSDNRPATAEKYWSHSKQERVAILVQELKDTRFLIPVRSESAYVLPHRSFGEFLAAVYLAEPVNVAVEWPHPSHGDTWDQLNFVEKPGENPISIGRLIDAKTADAGWQEIIMMLSGRLADPSKLLSQLTTEKDDIFCHRLTLAALCLPEISSTYSEHSAYTNATTTALFALWWQHRMASTDSSILHVTRALPILGGLKGTVVGGVAALTGRAASGQVGKQPVEGVPLLDCLHELLDGHHNDAERETAADLARLLGATAGTSEIVSRLQLMLASKKPKIRAAAVRAIGGIGPLAANDKIIDRIVLLLRDEAEEVCRSAAEVLGILCDSNAVLRMLDRLVKMLEDSEPRVWHHAAFALGVLGTASEDQQVVDAIIRAIEKLIRHDSPSVQEAAMQAASNLGHLAATDDILDRLRELLNAASTPKTRRAAARTAGALGAAAARSNILDRLFEMLEDVGEISHIAAQSLGRLARTHGAERARARLYAMLREASESRRTAAAYGIGALGGVAATSEVLQSLATMLRHGNRAAKRAAVVAVVGLGPSAARPDINSCLCRLLYNEDPEIVRDTALAVGSLGSAIATDESLAQELMNSLIGLLEDASLSIWLAAARAIGSLGQLAATSPNLQRLDYLLNTQRQTGPGGSQNVRLAAAETVRSLGGAIARDAPELGNIVESLGRLLDDDDALARLAAAHALGRLGGMAATDDTVRRLHAHFNDRSTEVKSAVAHAVGRLMDGGIRFYASTEGVWSTATA